MKLINHKIFRWFLYLCLFLIFIILIFYAALYNHLRKPAGDHNNTSYAQLDDTILISHAGGGLEVGEYATSKEALEKTARHGYKYVELDFIQTQNGDWVIFHDWKKNYLRYFIRFHNFHRFLRNRNQMIPETAIDFQNMNMRYNLTPMTLEKLGPWLKANPDIVVITDIKGSNTKCLTLIKNMMGGKTQQIIPQIYSPEEYEDVQKLGFKNIILTVYNIELSQEKLNELAQFSEDKALFALTVPKKWIDEDLDNWRPNDSVRLLTHTINDENTARQLMELGVSGIYTDYIIPPQAEPPIK